MLAQLVQDLVHLERREDGLDQHGRLDRASRDAEPLLREQEDVVPQPRLEMALELRQVEIRPGAARDQLLGVVEDVQAEVEQRAAHRLPVDGEVRFGQMPAARPHQQRRDLVAEPVALAAVRIGEVDLAADGVAQIDLALDQVRPGRRGRVLEVGHVHRRAAVQRVHDHLAIDRPGDLDPPVEQVARHRRDLPVRLADRARLLEEVGQLARLQAGVDLPAPRQQLMARRPEAPLELGQEGERVRAQDLVVALGERAQDLDARGHGQTIPRRTHGSSG